MSKMKCAGCSNPIRPGDDGWVSVAQKRMIDLNSHGEMETEYAFVACSWECVLKLVEKQW